MGQAGTFTAGNELVFSVLIYDAATNELVDPTTVTFSYALVSGLQPAIPTVTSYPDDDVIAKVSTGNYTCNVSTVDMAPIGTTVTLAGQWDTSGNYDLDGYITVQIIAPPFPSPF